jgi:hypothetical protein
MYSRKLQSFLKKLCINRAGVIAEAISLAGQANTYVETVNPHIADSLHWNVSRDYPETLSLEFFRVAKEHILKLRLGSVNVVADITEENFYGEHSGLYIHPWTGERGVVGRIRYLVVAILFRNKILPFHISILPIGAFKADYLGKAVQQLNTLGIRARSLLLDRGFYSGDIINTLQANNAQYLIFVPKNKFIQRSLKENLEDCIIRHEIVYAKNKRKHTTHSDHVLIHQYQKYDWAFATNIPHQGDLTNYVSLYRKRWNIETMFRVHDEARIKSKSIKPEIRLFYFIISMLFLLIWNLHHKEKTTFKRFIIRIHEELKQLFYTQDHV